MAIFKKTTVSVPFAKKGEDIKDGDIIQIANEGKKQEGKFGMQDIFLVKLTNGEEKNLSLNSTSLNNMIDAFGEDSMDWIGKDVKVWFIRMMVAGSMKQVLFLSHPDSKFSDEHGVFVTEGKQGVGKKNVLKKFDKESIPVIEEDF